MKKFVLIFIALSVFVGCSNPNALIKGNTIEIVGDVTENPWQHMVEFPNGYDFLTYIDYDDGDQIVVYSKVHIDCDTNVKLKGKVIELVGTSKRPGSDEVYSELQLKVETITCL